MKKIYLLLAAVSLIGFNSCEKNVSETAGNIPGMGNTPGELQVKEPYKVPDGISIIGDITGLDNASAKSGESRLADDSKSSVSKFGSGKSVRIQITLLNSRNHPRTVFFPKGLIWKCLNNEYQHGLQCQTAWVVLGPNEMRTINLDLYCANLEIPEPNVEGKYKILGITSSKVLWSLLDKIGWKKINYEMIFGSISGKGDESPSYEQITERLQLIVHNLTDRGIKMTAEDEAFLNSIPELAIEEIPVTDENSQYPVYFEEFKVSGQ